MTLPSLIVDHRQDLKFTAALRDYFTVTEKQLKVGDFVWTCPMGTVGIEDKAMPDLIASLNNKRLDDELRRLVESYAVPVLFIRGSAPFGNRYSHMTEDALEKVKLGRQLHGVFVWQSRDLPMLAAASLRELYDYLALDRRGGSEGVMREKKLYFKGKLGPRQEVIHQILGMTPGVRNRRGKAISIAEDTSLPKFLSWGIWDFEAAGFSRHMSAKLVAVLRSLEVDAHGSH